MATNYPTSLDSFTNPTPTDYLDSPSHAGQHSNANDALEALQAKVGINSSTVTTSHDYKLSLITGTNKALGTDWDNWQTYTGTMPTIVSTTGGVDLLALTDANLFLQKGAKVELTSTAGTHTYYVSDATSTGFSTNGETSPSGTITAMRYSYADCPFGFKKGEDWYTVRAYLNTAQTPTNNSSNIINLDTENYDDNSNFNTTAHEWTCPVSGKYNVIASARLTDSNTSIIRIPIQFFVDSAQALTGTQSVKAAGNRSVENSNVASTIYIKRGAVCDVRVFVAATTDGGLSFNNFSDNTFMSIQFTGI